MSQEIGVRGAKFGFGRGKLEVVLSKTFEEGADVVDTGSGVGGDDLSDLYVWSPRSRS